MENRVLIDALTDKYNALSNSLAAHATNCDNRLGIVEAATRQRDGDINALRTDLTIETERRENRDEALAASIETEAQRREAGDSQISVDAATRQELSEARHTLEMAIAAETSRREATDSNVTAEAAERARKDTALETRIAAIETKENGDFTSLSERIGDTNDAIGAERDDRIAAVAEVRTSTLAAVEAIRTDIGSTVNRAIADQTDALSRESQSRLTEDARLSTQISTALRSASDTNTRLTSLTQTVADNLAEAKAYSDSNLDTAKGYADGLKDELEDEIQSKVESVFRYRGQRESNQAQDLPLTGNQVGDVYNVKRYYNEDASSFVEGANVVWNGTGWDKLSEDLDLTIFATKEELTAAEMGLRAESTANRNLINTINGRLGNLPTGETQTIEQRISDLQTRMGMADNNIQKNQEDIASASTRMDGIDEALATKVGESGGTVYGGQSITFTRNGKTGPVILGGTTTTINNDGITVNGGSASVSITKNGIENDSVLLELPDESGTIATQEHVNEIRLSLRDDMSSLGNGIHELKTEKADANTVSAIGERLGSAEDAIGHQSADITLNGHNFGHVIKEVLQVVADEVTNLRTELGGPALGVEPVLTRLSVDEQSITDLQHTVAGIPSDVSTVVSGAVTTAKDYTDAREEAVRESLTQEATNRAEGDEALGQRIDNLAATIANDYAIADVNSVTMQLLNRTHNRFTYTGDGSSPLEVFFPQDISANRSRSFTLRLIVTNAVSGNLLRFRNYGGDGVPIIEYKAGDTDGLKVSQGVNVFTFTETAKDTYLVARIATATYTNP